MQLSLTIGLSLLLGLAAVRPRRLLRALTRR
jgi:hypothetical protein